MTKIDYLDETWNFKGGCTECSPGCLNCWARKQTAGRLKSHPLYEGLVKNGKWTGEIRLCTDIGRSDLLDKPFHWRKPRIIGVDYMGDLFHPKVPFAFIDQVMFKIIEWSNLKHTFLFLTKRPRRALKYSKHFWPTGGNIWFGVSISTQKEVEEKIPTLLKIPAVIRWISFEPLLEPINCRLLKHFDWVVIGAESKGGRPGRLCNLEDVHSIVRQCDYIGVPVWIKQLHIDGRLTREINEFPPDLRRREYPE